MTFLDCLLDEHRVIERMLAILGEVASDVRRRRQAPAITGDVLDFFEQFADRRHHAKEEELLFAALANHAIGGLIAVLMHQHELGRRHLHDLRVHLAAVRAGDPGGAGSFAASAAAFTDLMRLHMFIEDHDVFLVAEQVLSAGEQAELRHQFAALDALPAAVADRRRWDELAGRTPTGTGQVAT